MGSLLFFLCYFLHINPLFLYHLEFVTCSSEFYVNMKCPGQTLLNHYDKPDVADFQCLPPAQVTPSSDLWLPMVDYCGMPCDQLEPLSSWNPALILSSFLIQLCILLFLHFSPQKYGAAEFKFLKLVLTVDSLMTFCISLMPFVHNFSNFCDSSSDLLVMNIRPGWSGKFAFELAVAFSMSFLITIEWFWMLLRLKYFPMAKCVAFGDRQYQTIASPKKVNTISFVVLLFALLLSLGVVSLGTVSPNFSSRIPQIYIEHPILFSFEPVVIFLLQFGVSIMLFVDSVRHQAFKLSYVILGTFICLANAARIYCFHSSRKAQESFVNFYFEKIWTCNLDALTECAVALPSISPLLDVFLLILKLIDYILLFYVINLLLPFKRPFNVLTSIKEIMQPTSSSLLSKSKPKVTVLVSNPSSDGMIETFYSPSPSMNFKDTQIVHLGAHSSQEKGIQMKQLKPSLEVAKSGRSPKQGIVRAEVSNPDSATTSNNYTPQQQHKSQDHQLVNCPDCAKTIRVATWVNYLPQPTPKRKHFANPNRRGIPTLTANCMTGSPTSSNTFSPVYPLQVPTSPRINVPAAPSTVSRSFPGSPVMSHRSSSVGSSRKASSRSAKPESGNESLGVYLIPESHRRILSQYNASPVALRRKKPLSPLVTSDRKVENQSAMPSGSQSNPATLRSQRTATFNEPEPSADSDAQATPRARDSRPIDLDLESGNRISNSTTASHSNRGGSDSFDSEEDTRTEIGLCTSLL